MSGTATAIARKDWRELVRDRRLVIMALLTLLLALAAVVTAAAQVAAYGADRLPTEARDQTVWENQGARNPHGAAHFSRWALKPLTAGALLDPGVTAYAGNAVWMEAHSQNPPRNRPVEDAVGSIDFGQFSAAWTLQTLMPLLLFVIAAGLVARERERGTLRLLLATGASPRAIVPGKLGVTARVGGLLALPVIVAALVAAVASAGVAELPRLASWALVYVLFFAMVALIAVAVSAGARTVSLAMLTLVGLWLAAVVLVPRAGAGLAEAIAPAPAADAFWTAVGEDLERQPNVFGDDADAFGAAMAKRYNVATADALPVSLGGLQLEEAERLGNIVFDKHYGALAATYAAERDLLRWTGLLSPIAPLQNISMALAGTDTAHQLAFQRQAEVHRRAIVGQMNGDMIRNGAKADFDYLADSSLWKKVPPFAYRPPTLTAALGSIVPDILILLAWLVLAILLAASAARRLSREAL